MGGGQSKKYLSESDLSSAESDSEYFRNTAASVQAPEEMLFGTVKESDERTDAALRTVSSPLAEHTITVENVRDIETELDDSEIVSLVYILYDTSELALQDLQLLVASGRNPNLLYKWAKSEDYKGNRKWQAKFIEALSIIQNYKIIRDLGIECNKVDLIAKYMPHRPETSCYVNKIKKAFYLIAEKLGKEETIQFIDKMEKRVHERGIPVHKFDNDYLELYFLYWEQNHTNIEDVKRTCKELANDELYDILNTVIPSETPELVEIKPILSRSFKKHVTPKVRRRSTTRDTTNSQPRLMDDDPRTPSGVSGIFQEGPSTININGYSLNPNNPGVVLIINQEEFYTELDPKYKYLLHDDNARVKLETRDGTMMDRMRLEHVFGIRNFRVIVKENLAHYDVIKAIKDVVMSISLESSLIVCVLSHGDNGVVYGANSCRVEVNQIQNIICKKNKNLRGKPKVLILQSCQGKQCQKIEEDSSENEENANAMDGPTTIPSTADLLTFWATIPGFAAIRNKNNGSWLIQALCDEIEKLSPRYHFLDICTRVVEMVTSREWKEATGTNIMTPMVVTTLRKPFFLPAPKN